MADIDLSGVGTDALHEVAPLLRRCVELQPQAVVRVRSDAGADDRVVTAMVRLPFGVLVARTVHATGPAAAPLDTVLRAADLLAWLDGDATAALQPREHEWRSGVPPRTGWRRVETVPDDVIRPLVRQGALALQDAAAREGVPGAQPRAEVADALLDSVVLTAHDIDTDDADTSVGDRIGSSTSGGSVEVTLRTLSALTRMGFLTRGGPAHIDVAGRWVRVVGGYGTVYAERPGTGLGLMAPGGR